MWYFCGFDLTGQGTSSVVGNKAWIYKGTVGNLPSSAPEASLEGGTIVLYPNPAGDLLNISGLPLDFTGTATIFNSVGQAVLAERKIGVQWSLPTGRLQAGMYWMQLRSDKGFVITRKFVKK